jgi:hypothetical protein
MIDYTPKPKKESYKKFSTKVVKASANYTPIVKTGYEPRVTKQWPSKVSVGGSTSLKESPKYTGEKMLGVTILHKSCLQPVFSSQEAKDAASMRR